MYARGSNNYLFNGHGYGYGYGYGYEYGYSYCYVMYTVMLMVIPTKPQHLDNDPGKFC